MLFCKSGRFGHAYIKSTAKVINYETPCISSSAAVPKKKDGFQRVKIDTELSNSEIEAPDNVWVPATAK